MANFDLDNLRQMPDYQETVRWDLYVIQAPSAVNYPLPFSETLNTRCETSTIPKRTSESMEVNTRKFTVRIPGRTTYDESITLTFNETVDAAIRRLIKAWQDAIQTPNTGESRPANELKGIIRLEQLDRSDNPIYFYNLKGCWISDPDLGELNAEGGEIQKPSVTIVYDDFEDGFIG